ncbi:MAG: PD40 domain-containing protein, partial [Victivallales bacterium]|nr:PD40 domain-containing protein [Victivallales bacterium]
MRKITTLLFIALFVNLTNAQVQHANVIKEALDNPTLAIENFNGSDQARQKLERMFALSGWFKVVPKEQAAKAIYKVQAAGNETQFALNLQGAGKSISSQKQASDADHAARLVVDDVLNQLFNVQSLCDCKIAFVVPDAQNRREICTIYLDGTGFEILTKNNAISTEPSWGHANAMVYTLAKNNALHIVLMDLSKRVQRIISSARGLNSSAALSRNGQFVSLALSLGDQVDLYSHDLATNQTKRLTNDRYVESSPCWSPDGKQICYVSDMPGKPSLFIVSAAGGAAKRLQL